MAVDFNTPEFRNQLIAMMESIKELISVRDNVKPEHWPQVVSTIDNLLSKLRNPAILEPPVVAQQNYPITTCACSPADMHHCSYMVRTIIFQRIREKAAAGADPLSQEIWALADLGVRA